MDELKVLAKPGWIEFDTEGGLSVDSHRDQEKSTFRKSLHDNNLQKCFKISEMAIAKPGEIWMIPSPLIALATPSDAKVIWETSKKSSETC